MANGIVNKDNGDLLRAGFADFENDGRFNQLTEEYRTDVPEPWYIKRSQNDEFHRWNGSSWELVPQGQPISTKNLQYRVQAFSGFRLWTETHYVAEIVAVTGFSGFSGIGRTDEYLYSGTNLLGFSSTYYDTAGEAVSGSLTRLSTGPNGEIIFRRVS